VKEIQMSEISVVIPCYNGANYIEKCLGALEIQSFRNFNVIVIDDNSSDNSIEIIEKCIRNLSIDITLIINEVNLGPSLSREKGIKFSYSEWITFCDCDDWYESNFLEEMYKSVINNKVDITFCEYYKVGSKSKKIKSVNSKKFINYVDINSAIAFSEMSLCTMISSRRILISIEYSNLYHGEDAIIVQQAIQRAKKIYVLKKPLYNYFYRVGSSSKQEKKDSYLDLLSSFSYIENYIPNKYVDEKCFIGIKIAVYGGVLNLLKGNKKNWKNKIKILISDFSNKYPNWINNKYINELNIFKRIYIRACFNRNYTRLFLLTKFHNLIIRIF
jgi:teichuronic acid biosynthesis glycosyltransferase TuaG